MDVGDRGTVINAVMGTLLAYVLVRYRFPGRGMLSTIVDLPLAIPTLVTGLMILRALRPDLADRRVPRRPRHPGRLRPLGILLALLLVTLPFVVRSVQPVLLELDPAEEEAAATLGRRAAGRRSGGSCCPAIRPAIVAGALLTFARCARRVRAA